MAKKDHNQSNNGAESSALNIRPIVWFLASLAIATVIVFLLMGGMVKVLESRVEKAEGKPSPLGGERERIAPEPRVQLAPSNIEQVEGRQSPNLQHDNPLVEMERVRREESEKLNSYSWVDEKNGVVRIPIDEAKKLLLKQGLPIRKERLPLTRGGGIESAGSGQR